MLGYIIFLGVPALLTAAWLFYDVWSRQSLRILRDELFAVRDELFAYARSHEDLDFEDVAYGMLRANINGYIRFGESIGVLNMAKLELIERPAGIRPWYDRWENYLAEFPREIRNELLSFRAQALRSVFKHALRTSLIALVIVGYRRLAKRFTVSVETAGEAYAEERLLACVPGSR